MKKILPFLFIGRQGTGYWLLFFVLFNNICSTGQAQGFAKKNVYSVLDVGYSTSYFTGRDLPFRANKAFTPGFTIGLMTKQSPRIHDGFRFTISNPGSKYISLDSSGVDIVHYRCRINKYDFFLITDLIEHRSRYQKRPDVTPYLYWGIGWIKIRQFYRTGFEDKERVSSITEKKYDRRSLVLSPGFGFRFKLSKMMDLSLEVIYNYTFTRHLDMNYLDNFKVSSKKDSYLNINLKLGYI